MIYLEQYYIEKYLASEITFGFEFEFIADRDDHNEILRIIKKHFTQDGTIHIDTDSSVEGDDNFDYEEGYEWQSPVLSVNMSNMQIVINFFKEINASRLTYINDSCGFHVHLGYPTNNSSVQNSLWFALNLISDPKYMEELSFFKGIEFFNRDYARQNAMEDLIFDLKERTGRLKKSDGSGVKEESKKMIYKFLTDADKFDSFNFHPQGTLEWRGPRNFVDNDSNVKDFFIKKLFMFVLWTTNILNKTSVILPNGVEFSRREIDDLVKMNMKTVEQNLKRTEDSSMITSQNKRRTMMERADKVAMIQKYPFLSGRKIQTPIYYILEATVKGKLIPLIICKNFRGVIEEDCVIVASDIEGSVLENCYITTNPIDYLEIEGQQAKNIREVLGNFYFSYTYVGGSTLKNCSTDNNVRIDDNVNVI